MKAASYKYPMNGLYNETIATLPDGRTVTVNTQYSVVDVEHAPDCDMNRPGGRYIAPPRTCTCGNAMSAADTDELVADARINGKRGRPEKSVSHIEPIPTENHGFGWCDKCESYCYGDCDASN